jgi:hypothetical protein
LATDGGINNRYSEIICNIIASCVERNSFQKGTFLCRSWTTAAGNRRNLMRLTFALAATAMMALAAPSFAQQTLQPGSPGVGAGGQQPYTGGPSDNGPGPLTNGQPRKMNEGRAAAPDNTMAPTTRDNNQ